MAKGSRKERVLGCQSWVVARAEMSITGRTVTVVTWSPAAGLHHCNDLVNTKGACSPTHATKNTEAARERQPRHRSGRSRKNLYCLVWKWNLVFKGFFKQFSMSSVLEYGCGFVKNRTVENLWHSSFAETSITSCNVLTLVNDTGA